MEALLLAIYSFFVWLIFFKFKWLPWNKTSQITVVVIPIVALTALILCLNVFAPSSSDVRVIKYVVQVVPQVRGRVIEVPVQGNSPVKKGDLLFRVDPTPYQLQVDTLQAQLALFGPDPTKGEAELLKLADRFANEKGFDGWLTGILRLQGLAQIARHAGRNELAEKLLERVRRIDPGYFENAEGPGKSR